MENPNHIEIKFWEELRLGNTESLGGLYDLFADDLYAYGIQFSSEKSYVMDCIHDLFLDLYKYRKSISATNNVKYYLLRSLKNKILKKQQSKLIYLEDETALQRKNLFNYARSTEEEIEQEEFLEERTIKLSNAMSLLSKTQKKGLYLRFSQGNKYEDIAEIMNVSVETSRTIIYRGIKALRKELALLLIFFETFL